MTYKKGDISIAVEQIDRFGRNPSLWICRGNEYYKVASFGNQDKADTFCKVLEYILFDKPLNEGVKQ